MRFLIWLVLLGWSTLMGQTSASGTVEAGKDDRSKNGTAGNVVRTSQSTLVPIAVGKYEELSGSGSQGGISSDLSGSVRVKTRSESDGLASRSFAGSEDGAAKEASPEMKNLVVVSRNPEFFTVTLASIAILLSAITVIIGIFSGVALSVVIKVQRERAKIEKLHLSFDKHQQLMKNQLEREHRAMLVAMKRTAFGMARLHNAKRQVSDLLAGNNPNAGRLYQALQKTISYPDLECIRLYANVLDRFENNVDIVRCVRNGLVQYHRDPDVSFGQSWTSENRERTEQTDQ